ncbi:cation:proton antiporter [Iocasia frigidifontis]|uniref:Cation:proton antiporter n=1 Tax=Iocasia fonsfrigidae TaxID=2682810 RepID=A0A8A7KJA9_9FIRM|nr:monovalent cation/H(+) antiporter subunit G [Iocasia fonsfrigidae]QTL98917.1 cation:proton antiporter [Iocasia fonsfrigidae]
MLIREIISYLLMGAGGVFAIITVIGLIRFPDVYIRIHAAAVVLTISAVLVTFGVAVYVWELFLSTKIILIGLFFLISNPMATHSIARSSYQQKVALPRVRSVDEYADYLERGEK